MAVRLGRVRTLQRLGVAVVHFDCRTREGPPPRGTGKQRWYRVFDRPLPNSTFGRGVLFFALAAQTKEDATP